MANLVIYGYGGVGNHNIPIYGYGAGGSSAIVYIIPNTGTILGGTPFSIIGSTLSVLGLSDDFDGLSLNLSKWTPATTGTGSISVNDGLFLNVGPGAGIASIASVQTFKNFDVSSSFEYDATVERYSPTNPITFLRLKAKIDTNNYISIEQVWDPTYGDIIRVLICTNGVISTVTSSNSKSSSHILRLVRYGGRVQAFAGSFLLADIRGWRDDLVSMEMSSSNILSPIPLSTKVTMFNPQLLVTFGDDITSFVTPIVGRLNGVTPSTILPGAVSVTVHSATASEFAGIFTYFAPLQLTVSELKSVSMVVNNDNQLRDTSDTQIGLRL